MMKTLHWLPSAHKRKCGARAPQALQELLPSTFFCISLTQLMRSHLAMVHLASFLVPKHTKLCLISGPLHMLLPRLLT